ncbi:MAG: hypothetical protein NTU48_10320 [Legionellales bacterium]|nr:hypothetical protein [Legionellales bacterium]
MHEKVQESIGISVCTCETRDKFVLALGHDTPASVMKLKIFSASFQDITSTDIRVLENNKPCNIAPREIVEEYLTKAISQYCKDPSAILEFVYFGDVNLTHPGKDIFPDIFLDKNEFSHCIKKYFPNCVIIKRIMVSANDTILDFAKTVFAQAQRNVSFPIIVDTFLNKSHQDFYTEIHQIDSGLIDALLKYHRVFQAYASEDDEDDLDGFLPINCYLTAIQDNLELLEPFVQGSDYVVKLNDIRLNFEQKSDCFMELTSESLSEKKSTILSLVFSFLVPPWLRDDIKAQLSAEGFRVVFDAVFFVKFGYDEISEMIGTVIQEKQDYFVLYQEASTQMMEATTKVLTELNAFRSSVSEADFNPNIVTIVDNIIKDAQQLLYLLHDKSCALQQLEHPAERFMLKVRRLTHEALRKRTLSNSTFLRDIPLDTDIAKKDIDHFTGRRHDNPLRVESMTLFKPESTQTSGLISRKLLSKSNDADEITKGYF